MTCAFSPDKVQAGFELIHNVPGVANHCKASLPLSGADDRYVCEGIRYRRHD